MESHLRDFSWIVKKEELRDIQGGKTDRAMTQLSMVRDSFSCSVDLANVFSKL